MQLNKAPISTCEPLTDQHNGVVDGLESLEFLNGWALVWWVHRRLRYCRYQTDTIRRSTKDRLHMLLVCLAEKSLPSVSHHSSMDRLWGRKDLLPS